MTKYRIVERNRGRCEEPTRFPFYYLQIKVLGLFWMDYRFYPLKSIHTFDDSSTSLTVVELYYEELMKKQEPVKQTVVKTFYDETI